MITGKVQKEKTEILLMEYASGALDQASSLLIASYITLCPEARHYYKQCEKLGGSLIENMCEPVAMQSDSLHAVLNRLDTHAKSTKTKHQQAPSKNIAFCKKQQLPQPLELSIKNCQKKARWRTVAPGIRYYPMQIEDCLHEAMLIRMAPRAKSIRHEHPGTELTLVLEGGYSDEYGHYKQGDMVVIEEKMSHRPIADNTGCLALAVTSKPVRFTGTISSFLNIFIRTS